MKNLILLLVTGVFLNLQGFSQTQAIVIMGQVTDSTGQGVSNITVNYQTLNFNGSTQTNSSGHYVDSFAVQMFDSLYISIVDCNGNTLTNDYVINQASDTIVSNFAYCGSVVIPCSVSFSQTVVGNTGTFSVNAPPPGGIYQWDINGSFYQGTVVNHTFPGPGLYTACVTYSTFACSATACDSVLISSNPMGIDLAGSVYKSNIWAQSGLAVLFSADSSGSVSNLTALDTVALDSGGYFFTGLSSGSYTVLAMLDPNDPDFLNFFPTYYGDEVNWSSATVIILNASSYQKDINLVPISSAAPGPGTITGSVIEGPNKASGPGDPIKDVAVHLRDASGNALEFDMSDANGDFSFDNVALDTYQLILEIVNENMSPEIISLTGSQINSNTVFEFDTLGVRVVLGFENELAIQTRLYPNPAFDVLRIDFSEANISQAEITISNLKGQVLMSENSDNGEAQMAVGNLESGIYFIQVISEKGQFTKKFVKQ